MNDETHYAIPTARFCIDALDDVPCGPDIPVSVTTVDGVLVVTLGTGLDDIHAPQLHVLRRANGWEILVARSEWKDTGTLAIVDNGPTYLLRKFGPPERDIQVLERGKRPPDWDSVL